LLIRCNDEESGSWQLGLPNIVKYSLLFDIKVKNAEKRKKMGKKKNERERVKRK
jgi:hypothetical protein